MAASSSRCTRRTTSSHHRSGDLKWGEKCQESRPARPLDGDVKLNKGAQATQATQAMPCDSSFLMKDPTVLERPVAASLRDRDRTDGFLWCQAGVPGVRLGQEGGEEAPHSEDTDALDRGLPCEFKLQRDKQLYTACIVIVVYYAANYGASYFVPSVSNELSNSIIIHENLYITRLYLIFCS